MKKILLLAVFLLSGCIEFNKPDTPSEIIADVSKEAAEFYEKGLEFEKTGDIENAKAEYERAVSVYAYFPEANMKLYEIYKNQNNTDHAEEHYGLAQVGLEKRK